MSFIASRRSTINNAETVSGSPSHNIIALGVNDVGGRGNRRPKKRERSSVAFESEFKSLVDNSSPRHDNSGQMSSVSVDSRVTGLAGWAVTQARSRQQKFDELEEDSEQSSPSSQQPSPLPRHPRTAWSDDAVGPGVDGSMYVNSGFEPAASDDGDDVPDCSVAEMLDQLQLKIDASQSRLSAWKELRAAAERDAVEARQVYRTMSINEHFYFKTQAPVTPGHSLGPPFPTFWMRQPQWGGSVSVK